MRTFLFLLALALIGTAPSSSTAGTDTLKPAQPALQTVEEADRSANALVESYVQVGQNWMTVLQQQGAPNGAQVRAAYVLGRLRFATAASILVERIALKADKIDLRLEIARWGPYPAAEALERIGGPAVTEILGKLPAEKDALRLKLMVQVLRSVDGDVVARVRLRTLLDAQTDPSSRALVESAINMIDAGEMASPIRQGGMKQEPRR